MAPPSVPGALLSRRRWARPVWLHRIVSTSESDGQGDGQVVQSLETVDGRMCLRQDRQRELGHWHRFFWVVHRELSTQVDRLSARLWQHACEDKGRANLFDEQQADERERLVGSVNRDARISAPQTVMSSSANRRRLASDNPHEVDCVVIEDSVSADSEYILTKVRFVDQRRARIIRVCTYSHGRHELLNMLVVQLQYTVQNTNLVVPQGLLALSVECQERSDAVFI